MTSEFTNYSGSDGAIKPVKTARRALAPKEILVKITHSGVCATDLAYVEYGIALGHEGVGIVEAIGSDVTQFKVGDRAGGGYHRNSCGHCKYCLSGEDIWCYNRSVFGEGDYQNGTFGEYYIGTETYLHKIPESLSSEAAAPLQCAGATVYSALKKSIKASDRVGIVGIGGLGHLAIQFAVKLGAEVVVFSTSADKEAEAKGFGASEFYLLDQTDKLKAPVDVLVVAGSRYPDWKKFMVKEVLARMGTIVPLAAPHAPLELPSFPMFFEGYNVKSSLVASRGVHDEMLEFSARHGIEPLTETFPLSEEGIAQAVDKLKGNRMRYRAVLVAQS